METDPSSEPSALLLEQHLATLACKVWFRRLLRGLRRLLSQCRHYCVHFAFAQTRNARAISEAEGDRTAKLEFLFELLRHSIRDREKALTVFRDRRSARSPMRQVSGPLKTEAPMTAVPCGPFSSETRLDYCPIPDLARPHPGDRPG